MLRISMSGLWPARDASKDTELTEEIGPTFQTGAVLTIHLLQWNLMPVSVLTKVLSVPLGIFSIGLGK